MDWLRIRFERSVLLKSVQWCGSKLFRGSKLLHRT